MDKKNRWRDGVRNKCSDRMEVFMTDRWTNRQSNQQTEGLIGILHFQQEKINVWSWTPHGSYRAGQSLRFVGRSVRGRSSPASPPAAPQCAHQGNPWGENPKWNRQKEKSGQSLPNSQYSLPGHFHWIGSADWMMVQLRPHQLFGYWNNFAHILTFSVHSKNLWQLKTGQLVQDRFSDVGANSL